MRSSLQARRDLERELAQYQNRMGDPEVEKKLKKQVHKFKALLQVLTMCSVVCEHFVMRELCCVMCDM